MVESGTIKPAFMSAISVARSTCGIVRLVPDYQAVVLSYQLVLKLAEIQDVKLKKEVIISLLCPPAASSWNSNYLFTVCAF